MPKAKKPKRPTKGEQGTYVGLRAEFFHPHTLGVMHTGVVTSIAEGGKMVYVRFFDDKRSLLTIPDHYIPQSGY